MVDFREVLIEWNDEPDNAYLVKVGIDAEWVDMEEDDDDVFFWFSDEAEYKSAFSGEGFEFKIIEEGE